MISRAVLLAGLAGLLLVGVLRGEPGPTSPASPSIETRELELAATPAGTVVPDPVAFQGASPTDDPRLEAEVRKLAGQLRCPTCQALSIADSPSELSREMEGVIRARLQEGMTPEEVRQSFVEAYGEWVLLSPNPAGFNLLVYVLPFAVLLFGTGMVVIAMRKWLAAPGQEQAPPSS